MSENSDMVRADLTPAAYELAVAMGIAYRKNDLNISVFEDVEEEHWWIEFCPKDFVKIWKVLRAMIVLGHDDRVAHVLMGAILAALPSDFEFETKDFSYGSK